MKKILKDSLIPHETNNFAPHLLQRAALLGMLGMVLLSFLLTNFQAFLWQSSDWLVGAILPAVVVDFTNQERDTLALPALVRNPVLDEAAKLKAADMAKHSYFAHYSPTNVSPWHWFEQAGYTFAHAGENLAIHFSDSGEVVEAWMDSPTHRANIVNGNYQEIGVGTAKGKYQGFDTVFVVQLFGTQAEATTLPVVAVEKELQPVIVAVSDNDSVPAVLAAETATVPAETSVTLVPLSANDVTENDDEVSGIEVFDGVTTDEFTLAIQQEPIDSLDMEVTEVIVEDNYISMYSGLAASSSDLMPMSGTLLAGAGGTTAPMMARLATEPNTVLQVLYILLGLLVGLALFMSVLIEWRKQHPVQVAYGVSLLVLMSGLFYIHSALTSGAVVL